MTVTPALIISILVFQQVSDFRLPFCSRFDGLSGQVSTLDIVGYSPMIYHTNSLSASYVNSAIDPRTTFYTSHRHQQHDTRPTSHSAQQQAELPGWLNASYDQVTRPSTIEHGTPSPWASSSQASSKAKSPINPSGRSSAVRPDAPHSFTSTSQSPAGRVFHQAGAIPRISGRRRSTQLMMRATLGNFAEPTPIQCPSPQAPIRKMTQRQVLAVNLISTSTIDHEHPQSGSQSLCHSSLRSTEDSNVRWPEVVPSLDGPGAANDSTHSAEEDYIATGAQSNFGMEQSLTMSPSQRTLLVQQMRQFRIFMEFARNRDVAACPTTAEQLPAQPGSVPAPIGTTDRHNQGTQLASLFD